MGNPQTLFSSMESSVYDDDGGGHGGGPATSTSLGAAYLFLFLLVLWISRVQHVRSCILEGELDEQKLLRSKDHQTLMAKRSRKRLLQYEKDQAGCIWGFIGIFDFRYGRSTRKLLSDRRRGSKHPVGAGFSRTKVKTLESSHEKYQGIEVKVLAIVRDSIHRYWGRIF
ncbi:hypothetical protein RJ640_002309 [Escallonia rubra]|uniref:Transmembrane protein n=1 Tax=Escallonia rubra TaxID=112253 RepID=A0AA88QM57_9ASTE|nr:hypothetical protein RJ640_002309 [Escallonia rubra]